MVLEKTLEQMRETLTTALLQDEALRAEFIADPNAVASRVLGVEIPPFVRLMPVEVPSNAIIIPLPSRTSGDELSDLDLEVVAGGKTEVGQAIKVMGLAVGAGLTGVFTGANSSQTEKVAGKLSQAYDELRLNRGS